MSDSYIPFKKPGTITTYTEDQIKELAKCSVDPTYFIENYIKVQHPARGAINFKPYDYQKKISTTIHNYKDVIIMCGRQMGKCVTATTSITYNDKQCQIKNILKLSFKEFVIDWLEIIKIKLARYKITKLSG